MYLSAYCAIASAMHSFATYLHIWPIQLTFLLPLGHNLTETVQFWCACQAGRAPRMCLWFLSHIVDSLSNTENRVKRERKTEKYKKRKTISESNRKHSKWQHVQYTGLTDRVLHWNLLGANINFMFVNFFYFRHFFSSSYFTPICINSKASKKKMRIKSEANNCWEIALNLSSVKSGK